MFNTDGSMFPKEINANGTATTYYADYAHLSTMSNYYAMYSGGSFRGSEIGAFYIHLATEATGKAGNFSASLSCKPLAQSE